MACVPDGVGQGEVPWKGASERVRIPFCALSFYIFIIKGRVMESSCLGLQLKVGGKFHRRLNTGGRPIANKYCEGKMKRTLKRESKSA